MARSKRQFDVFSLSFLDIMSCGFGAVILVFMIINHASEARTNELSKDLMAEVSRLEIEVIEGEQNLVQLRNTIERTDDETVETQGLSARIIEQLKTIREQIAMLENETTAKQDHINRLKSDLQSEDKERKRLAGSQVDDTEQGTQIRSFVGDGNRQYLTGLKMGGDRVLILIDSSASMLDQTIVNIIRKRNMPLEQRLAARKWQRAVMTADWLTSQLAPTSQFQIFSFNTEAKSLVEGSGYKWLDAGDGEDLSKAVEALRVLVPQNGTSMDRAVEVINRMTPRPDNVYLIVDGLPTQGKSVREGGVIDGRARERLFRRSMRDMPARVPINIILFPMEGDPMAASLYWQLAQATGGSFMAPSKDWP